MRGVTDDRRVSEVAKKKSSSERKECPPRKLLGAVSEDQTNDDIGSRGEREGAQIFFGAIMGGFSTSGRELRESAKRKKVELRAVHTKPPKNLK